jgi:hypothetical protein
MRVLHVIDPGSPGGGACTLQLLSAPLSRLTSVDQHVLLIGTERHEALARRCGVQPTGRITAPANEPLLAGFIGRSFRAFVSAYEEAFGAYDIVHSWTARSTLLTMAVMPRRRRIATLTVGPVNGVGMHALASMIARRPAVLLASSVAVKRDYLVMGIGEEHLDVLPPAVYPEAVEENAPDRDTVRERWSVTEGRFMMGLLAEPASWCDARHAMHLVAVLVDSGRDVGLVVHPRAQRWVEALRYARKLGLEDRLVAEDQIAEPWRCIRGLDAAIMLSDESNVIDLAESGSPFAILTGGGRALRPMPGVLPALWAMSAGVPVVADQSLAMQEIVENEGTGLLVPQRDIPAMVQALIRLYDDSRLRLQIAQAARAAVQSNFHVSAYCVRLKEMYQRMLEGRATRVVSEQGEAVIEKRQFVELRR